MGVRKAIGYTTQESQFLWVVLSHQSISVVYDIALPPYHHALFLVLSVPWNMLNLLDNCDSNQQQLLDPKSQGVSPLPQPRKLTAGNSRFQWATQKGVPQKKTMARCITTCPNFIKCPKTSQTTSLVARLLDNCGVKESWRKKFYLLVFAGEMPHSCWVYILRCWKQVLAYVFITPVFLGKYHSSFSWTNPWSFCWVNHEKSLVFRADEIPHWPPRCPALCTGTATCGCPKFGFNCYFWWRFNVTQKKKQIWNHQIINSPKKVKNQSESHNERNINKQILGRLPQDDV